MTRYPINYSYDSREGEIYTGSAATEAEAIAEANDRAGEAFATKATIATHQAGGTFATHDEANDFAARLDAPGPLVRQCWGGWCVEVKAWTVG